MNDRLRNYFDRQLERVIDGLPDRIRKLMDDVPLVVEDYPSDRVMAEMGVRHRSDLCGLYTGIPLTNRSIEHSGIPSDVVHIYREGILKMSESRDGRLDEKELLHQIRVTVLHELGHHHGLDEDELERLGY